MIVGRPMLAVRLVVRLSLVALALLSGATHARASGESTPRFGKNVIQLYGNLPAAKTPVYLETVYQAPQGQYVLGISFDTIGKGNRSLYLWDVAGAAAAKLPVKLTPQRHYEYPSAPGQNLFRLSPDGRRVALRTATDWRILTVPQLKVERVLPVKIESAIEGASWWPNGQLLATSYRDGSVIVWDTISNRTYKQMSKAMGPIHYVPGGWIVYGWYHDTSSSTFAFCRTFLERCDEYTAPGHQYDTAASPDGTTVYAQNDIDSGERLYIWRRQRNGQYQRDDMPPGELKRVSEGIAFSPTGKNLATNSFIWDATTLTQIRRYSSHPTLPVWLATDDYFVVLDKWRGLALYLYAMDREAPIDRLDLKPLGILDIDFEIEGFFIVSVSDDGKWILIAVGSPSAWMIPIVYE